MLSCNEGSFQAHSLGGRRCISVAGSAQGRDLDDRLIFAGLYWLFPKDCDALAIVKPDTIVRWHRASFRLYWRWNSRRRGAGPTVPLEIRRLIREMSMANPLWGAPRIHGELLKLDIAIGQTSVAK